MATSTTGNSIIRLADRMDAGRDAEHNRSLLLAGPETAGELHDRLSHWMASC